MASDGVSWPPMRCGRACPWLKGIERHHLFPNAYLKREGIGETKRINQIANMALVERSDNITISDQAPAEYCSAQIAQKGIHDDRLTVQRHWHALPQGWEHLPYEDFLAARRRLMGTVVRDAFAKLTASLYTPTYPDAGPAAGSPVPPADSVSVTDLMGADLLPEGTTLLASGDAEIAAAVLNDGRLSFGGQDYDTPADAAATASGASPNGCTYWVADLGVDAGAQPLRASVG
jgi:hypothetical protein